MKQKPAGRTSSSDRIISDIKRKTRKQYGAEAIGYAQDLGSIDVGKLADLIVLAKNPLEDIRNTNTIKYVMKNGELFEGDTLDQIWPRRKTPPRMWWWDEQP